MNMKKPVKTGFLTLALCLAGLSMSNINISASNGGVEARLFKNIEVAAEKGKLSEAKDDIQRVLRLNPRHQGAIFFAGLYSYEIGNYDNADKFLRRVLNNPTYGARANQILADIRLSRYRNRFKETLEVHLTGESFSQAIQLCEEALESMPDNSEIVFKAAYISAILGRQESAEKYQNRYIQLVGNNSSAAELQTFLNGWFADGYEPESVLDQLLSITDRSLLSPPVRRRIKELIVATRATEKFEAFIKREKQIPGADTGSLERELITFLIDQKLFDKALEHVNRRPIDSIDDNLLYVKILGLTGQEKKAMSNARQLITAAPQDLRTYQAWIEAWLAYVDNNKQPPDGNDAGGKNFIETADEILERLKPEKLVISNPDLLLNLLRLAVVISNEKQIELIKPQIFRVAYNDQLAALLLKACDEMLIFKREPMAAALLESARNQLPDYYHLHLKLAEIYMSVDPAAGAKILEGVLLEKPDLIRAVLLWADCMNLAGETSKAEDELLRRLADRSISEVVRRQLNAKLEVLRMQNVNRGPAAPQNEASPDEPADPTIPQRDLSPLELSQEEMEQLEDED